MKVLIAGFEGEDNSAKIYIKHLVNIILGVFFIVTV